MSTSVDKSLHTFPLDQPFSILEASEAFNGLTEKEQQYAFYLSKAAWTGGLITLIQTSIESPKIFILIHKYFRAENIETIKENALKAGFTQDELSSWFIYASGVYSNSGNYKGFGDSKFIPSLDENRLKELLNLSPVWSELEPLWDAVSKKMYDLSNDKLYLRFPPNGCTTYFINCTEDDSAKVLKWLKGKGIECYNLRCVKTKKEEKTFYEIRLASKDIKAMEKEEIDGVVYSLSSGDYSPLMSKVVQYLEKAIPFTSNNIEANMLQSYCKSFETGSLDEHKNGSRYWIQDKGPSIETYIGFIETYRDPAGVCGEFEGFVAAVNREMSAKFANLVDNAEKYLELLPWGKNFEKDRFLKPDFTSLDVLAFSGSGVPAGINIPNYDEIRQNEGFKNVSLGNVIPANFQTLKTPFLSDADAELFQKYRQKSFEVQVGLHELLGHGSGKLFQKSNDGKLNYPEDLMDPLTQKPISSYYESGDTYDSVFGALSSSYEECRAEAVGLYLSLETTVLHIFGHFDDVMEDIIYTNWLCLVWAGLFGLEQWNATGGWLQAHSQARYVLFQVLLEAGVVSLEQVKVDNGDSLNLSLDRTKFKTVGKEAIKQFLLKLQVYKATANIAEAQKMYQKYSAVKDTDAVEWRRIVLANKRPRKMLVQPNIIQNESKAALKTYTDNAEGLIQSWNERLDNPDELYDALEQAMDNF